MRNNRQMVEAGDFPPIRILFVCHGNICRSPMAEFVMKDLVQKAGCADQFEIASAATTTEDLGSDMYPNAKEELRRHEIPSEWRPNGMHLYDTKDYKSLRVSSANSFTKFFNSCGSRTWMCGAPERTQRATSCRWGTSAVRIIPPSWLLSIFCEGCH